MALADDYSLGFPELPTLPSDATPSERTAFYANVALAYDQVVRIATAEISANRAERVLQSEELRMARAEVQASRAAIDRNTAEIAGLKSAIAELMRMIAGGRAQNEGT